ncbi:ATP-binding protein [Burkholderia pseudomallei]|uniref:ATP-binding protein n=1 Tax=Burkholderia pseudomallei TaxID=28450 RepID=UPI000E67C696|nr:ATP-binding protein [Burkholderia pseudomallei]RIV63259.1 ATP-binding protein [Burkholderia pseudomallei]RIV73071.1 ATP-binding protein [Burkholderia pseudomallei]
MAKQEQHVQEVHDELGLVASIRASQGTKDVVHTTLKTDERVIARVTDGIYRQPGSALRELISNAYDADATRVVIKTDAPRFERISVEDDGHGMGPEALAHLLLHIGGSAKRSVDGPGLGITSPTDPMRSPGGRRLIGKIGIGLFSVSQLTHSFQIITKIKGDAYRTVATVALRQYADEDVAPGQDGDHKFESGKVNIWREKAADTEAHGTTIILTSIRPQARDTLRSRDVWSVIEQNESQPESEERQAIDPPRYHIGRVDSSGDFLKKTGGHVWALPWEKGDAPDEAFRKLVQSVWDEVERSTPNPQLDRIFDYYLRMVWQLSLAVPLPYVDGHLFDMDLVGWADAFMLSNQPKGAAQKIDLAGGGPIREKADLKDPVGLIGKFDVFFDELKLFRPLKFTGLPTTNNALKTPLVFIGKCREAFSKLPRELSGGPLAFEAYLFWTPKVAPVEHQGSLIRIHGSSGTLFDSTFMRYQVSELTRLRQITCEIFVSEGLDSALNIDRESFNNAHPHSVYITKWLHSALRQLASAQKRLASEAREQTRGESKGVAVSEIQRVASQVWKQENDDPGASPPSIELSSTGVKSAASGDAYVFSRAAVVPDRPRTQTAKAKAQNAILEEKLKAIAQVLASFGLLDAVPKRKQEKLLKAIYEILDAPGE